MPEGSCNRLLKRREDAYINRVCSLVGFEGIREQDIIPLLMQRFYFRLFSDLPISSMDSLIVRLGTTSMRMVNGTVLSSTACTRSMKLRSARVQLLPRI